MAGPDASARPQNRTRGYCTFSTFGCPDLCEENDGEPPFRLIHTRFCQKRFCAIVFAMGEDGRKWGILPKTLKMHLCRALTHPFEAETFIEILWHIC